ncbi:hypothetical protein QW060_19295 [Myroides ceti]|uniref:Uncharacterized protein n=1 Tax=Paenimyroides ceti TaxID=395087 RepID=A0ABT8CYJ3_9FLAO|nr:hypothetical protein [Paenimyroides ceti]MDN3707770.1 hypothetical protein [Paenimyroides ceti]MDN3709181.1 hypothetical protein [Paenimyroides ceti]
MNIGIPAKLPVKSTTVTKLLSFRNLLKFLIPFKSKKPIFKGTISILSIFWYSVSKTPLLPLLQSTTGFSFLL